jgi:hypothetical protein
MHTTFHPIEFSVTYNIRLRCHITWVEIQREHAILSWLFIVSVSMYNIVQPTICTINWVHPNLLNFTFIYVTPPLISQNPMKWLLLVQFSSLVVTFPSHIAWVLTLSRCHHCNYYHYCNVDFVLFHNIICYTTSLYHESMLALHTSLLSHALWLPHA